MPHSVKTESLTNQVYKLLKKQFGSRDLDRANESTSRFLRNA